MIFLSRSLYSIRSVYAIPNVRYPAKINSISSTIRYKSDDKKPPAPDKGNKIGEKAKAATKEVPKVASKDAAKSTTKEAPKTVPKEAPKLVQKEPPLSDLEKMRKLQALFQQDNGLPVFLKGGAKDQLLYRGTLGLCLLGLILVLKLFVGMIFSK